MERSRWLLDTNVLLRFFGPWRNVQSEVDSAMESLVSRNAKLYYTSQILAEFWNVSTRPESVNGLGRSITETNAAANLIEETLLLAGDNEAVHHAWRNLLVEHQVSGAQVHDARIVATMMVNQVTNLLTMNVRDFRRYSAIVAQTPQEMLGS